MRNFTLSIFFLFFFQIFNYAQLDTTYIRPLKSRFLISPTITFQSFRLSFNNDFTAPIFFQTKNIGVGFRMRYQKFALGVSIPVLQLNNEGAKDSDAYALNIEMYPKKLFIQSSLRYYKGLENVSRKEIFPTNLFRSDLKMWHLAMTGYHLFNSNISLRTAFKMEGRQLKSAGSFIVGGTVNYQIFKTDSLTIQVQDQSNFLLDKFRSAEIGFSGGYAYAHVLRHWTFTGMAAMGSEFKRLALRRLQNQAITTRLSMTPRLRLLGSVVYNRKKKYFGLTGFYFPGLEGKRNVNTSILEWRIRFWVGWRLQ